VLFESLTVSVVCNLGSVKAVLVIHQLFSLNEGTSAEDYTEITLSDVYIAGSTLSVCLQALLTAYSQ